MKNTPKIILTVFMLVGIVMSPVSAAFPDVLEDHIYSDAINYVQEEGLVSGFSDGTYRPENTITRAEFTKIVINSLFEVDDQMFEYDDGICYEGPDDFGFLYLSGFVDVKNHSKETMFAGETYPETGNPFSVFICIAKQEGIINGYEDGTFRPDNPITVSEASKIISNAYGFTDLQSGPEGDVFRPFVDALTDRNAIPKTVISIDQELKRGEMAQIIYSLDGNQRYIRPVVKNPHELNGVQSEYLFRSDGTNRELYSYLMPNSWTKMLANNEVELDKCGIHRFYDNYDNSKFELTFSIQVPNDPCARSGKGDYGMSFEQVDNVEFLGNEVVIVHNYNEVYSDLSVDYPVLYNGEQMSLEVQILSLTNDKNTNTEENVRVIKSLINSIQLDEYLYYLNN